jgi:hypothetical protein
MLSHESTISVREATFFETRLGAKA